MNRQELMRELDQYMSAHREDLLEDLKTLVRIPSVSTEGTSEKPFGEECARALDQALSMAAERGCHVNNHDYWYGTACCDCGGGKEPGLIGIFTHLDVVEAGENWIYDPFEPVEKDGFLIGRGAGDNKSGAVIGLYTIQAIRDLNIPLKSNILLYFGCNEEKGMKDAERFAKEHVMPDYSMVPDLFFPVCYGEKGNLKMTLKSKTGFRQIVSFAGGKADNVVPDRAEAEILCQGTLYEDAVRLAEGRTDIQVRKTEDRVQVTALGIGGHSSMPAGTVDAIWLLTDFLKDLPSLAEEDRKICGAVAEFSGDYKGEALGISASDEPSGDLVCTAVRAGLDGSLPQVVFSARYPVTDYRERIEASLIRVIQEKDFVLESSDNNNPLYISRDDPYVQTLMKVYHEVTGKDNQPYVIDGGTYARKLQRAVGYGGGNGVSATFLPKGHGRVHQPDEARNIQGILDAVKLYVMSVIEIDQLIQKEKEEKKAGYDDAGKTDYQTVA